MGIASSQNIDNALVNRWLQSQHGVGADYRPDIPALNSWLSPYLLNGTLDMGRVPEIASAIRSNDPTGTANISGGWFPGGSFAGAPITSVNNGNVNFDSTANTGDWMGSLLLGAAMSGVAGLGISDLLGSGLLSGTGGGYDLGGDLGLSQSGMPSGWEYTAKAASDITPTPMVDPIAVHSVTDGVLPTNAGWGSNTLPGIMGNGGALQTGSTGGNMGFFDSILGADPWGAGVADPALSVGNLNVPDYAANVLDQVAPAAGATGNSAWDTFLNGGSGVLGGAAAGAGMSSAALNGLRAALQGAGLLGGASGVSRGGSILDQITGNPLGSAFNALPFGLALMQANSQKNDIAPYIQNLNNLAQQYSGNQSSYLQSLTDPYDQLTGVNRQKLLESLNQRGVAGSSFGDQAINNFDYTAGLGRADLLGKGIAQGAQTGAGINTQAINAINARNLSSNALIGAGLNASGQLFNPVQNDQFNLKQLFGVAV